VDDDPDSLLLTHILSSEGYTVATASNGREALRRLAASRPFVILLNLEMPIMDGRAFREHQLRLGVVPTRNVVSGALIEVAVGVE